MVLHIILCTYKLLTAFTLINHGIYNTSTYTKQVYFTFLNWHWFGFLSLLLAFLSLLWTDKHLEYLRTATWMTTARSKQPFSFCSDVISKQGVLLPYIEFIIIHDCPSYWYHRHDCISQWLVYTDTRIKCFPFRSFLFKKNRLAVWSLCR